MYFVKFFDALRGKQMKPKKKDCAYTSDNAGNKIEGKTRRILNRQ
jgi:hypothetical protein